LWGTQERVVRLCVLPYERGQSGVRVDVPEFVGAEGWAALIFDFRQFGIKRGERRFAFDQSLPVEIESLLAGRGGGDYYYWARV
jgi:hypothetical protein